MALTPARANWVFLRLLGVVYVIAFWSLAVQGIGLIGAGGILPAGAYPDTRRAHVVLERARSPVAPPRLGVWLMLWLVFRLMFGSGAVKLASGDPTWRNLTAMAFHYETQPIPTPAAWYAYQLPLWIQKASTAATLA